MFRQAPSFPYHDLGIVEDGNTASRAISKDAYVIWKGSSYFASTDILQGATLEEDVNLTAIPDGVINGVISALNNNSLKYETRTQDVTFSPSRHIYDITFTQEFDNIPAISVSCTTDYDGFGGSVNLWGITLLTKTGFRLSCYRNDSQSNNATIRWVAIG